jgi:NAD dependent epimerase/dehydratase
MLANPNTYADQPVLVTGAGGFIGSHLTECLLAAGAHVRATVKYNGHGHWGHLQPYQQNPHPRLSVWMGDITDPYWVMHAVADQRWVFHLAALIGIPYSYVAPQHYVGVNIQGTLHVLEACRHHGTHRLIHTSTSETYGTAQFAPQTEQHPLTAQSPYAATKIAADKLAESYYRSFNLPVATLRPFNAYGPRQSLRAVIPTIVQQALTQPQITLGDVTPRRDFTFVQDTVQAFCQLGLAPSTALGQVWNAGSGHTVSIAQIVEKVLHLVGKPQLPVITDAERIRPPQSEVTHLQADATALHKLTGWAPQTTLSQGLQQVVDYWQPHIEAGLTPLNAPPPVYVR